MRVGRRTAPQTDDTADLLAAIAAASDTVGRVARMLLNTRGPRAVRRCLRNALDASNLTKPQRTALDGWGVGERRTEAETGARPVTLAALVRRGVLRQRRDDGPYIRVF